VGRGAEHARHVVVPRKRFEAAVLLDPKADYALQNLCALALADGRTLDAISSCRQAEAARRGRPSRLFSSESR
jgi:hypothetical protein